MDSNSPQQDRDISYQDGETAPQQPTDDGVAPHQQPMPGAGQQKPPWVMNSSETVHYTLDEPIEDVDDLLPESEADTIEPCGEDAKNYNRTNEPGETGRYLQFHQFQYDDSIGVALWQNETYATRNTEPTRYELTIRSWTSNADDTALEAFVDDIVTALQDRRYTDESSPAYH